MDKLAIALYVCIHLSVSKTFLSDGVVNGEVEGCTCQ